MVKFVEYALDHYDLDAFKRYVESNLYQDEYQLNDDMVDIVKMIKIDQIDEFVDYLKTFKKDELNIFECKEQVSFFCIVLEWLALADFHKFPRELRQAWHKHINRQELLDVQLERGLFNNLDDDTIDSLYEVLNK